MPTIRWRPIGSTAGRSSPGRERRCGRRGRRVSSRSARRAFPGKVSDGPARRLPGLGRIPSSRDGPSAGSAATCVSPTTGPWPERRATARWWRCSSTTRRSAVPEQPGEPFLRQLPRLPRTIRWTVPSSSGAAIRSRWCRPSPTRPAPRSWWRAEDFGPYGRRRDAAVAQRASTRRPRAAVRSTRPTQCAPGSVMKDDGRRTRCSRRSPKVWQRPVGPAPIDTPSSIRWHRRLRSDGHPSRAAVRPPSCRRQGRSPPTTWPTQFLADAPRSVRRAAKPTRSVAGTSRLSPYLRWGTPPSPPTPRAPRRHRSQRERVPRPSWLGGSSTPTCSSGGPTRRGRTCNRRMDAMPVDRDAPAQERFARWATGSHRLPDRRCRACGSSHATGWMHNRVRMITASFLVKDLHLPWQWGATHFMNLLVDGDLASNSHGWQWTAGTGTDAAPVLPGLQPGQPGRAVRPRPAPTCVDGCPSLRMSAARS